jgi:propionyl-CoA synthetase
VSEASTDPSHDPRSDELRSRLGADPGLCWACRHSKVNETRRGTAYIRCTRAEWDDRLRRYPPLPVLSCVGYEQREAK